MTDLGRPLRGNHATHEPSLASRLGPSGECQAHERNATEAEADAAILILERAINAARNSNQAGENAVVRAANAISAKGVEL